MKALINSQLVDVKVLKTRKLFWLFEQVLVEYKRGTIYSGCVYDFDVYGPYRESTAKWIPKSNLIEDYD